MAYKYVFQQVNGFLLQTFDFVSYIRKKTAFSICLLLLIFTCTYAQEIYHEPLRPIKRLNTQNGLSDDGVTSLLEDSRGYIWIGTYGGLNKYNGYNITIYGGKSNSNTLTSHRIRALAEDRHGNIWIATDKGIDLYNYKLDIFQTLYSYKEHENYFIKPAIEIIFDKNSDTTFVVTEGCEIFRFSGYKFDTLVKYSLVKENLKCMEATQISNNHLFLATIAGAYIFNIQQKSYTQVFKNHFPQFHSVVHTNKNELLCGMKDTALIVDYEIVGDLVIFSNHKKIPLSPTNYRTWMYRLSASELSDDNMLAIGLGNKGAYLIDNYTAYLNGSGFTQYYLIGNDIFDRSSEFLFSSNNQLWYATYDKGIYIFTKNMNPFSALSNKFKAANITTSIPEPTRIIEISPNNLLVYWINENSILFNTETLKAKEFNLNLIIEPLWPHIIIIDKQGTAWFTVNFGGNFLNCYKNGKSRKFEYRAPDNIPLYPTSMLADVHDNIWLGDEQAIYYFVKSNPGQIDSIINISSVMHTIDPRIDSPHDIWRLYSDTIGQSVWATTLYSGVFCFDLSKGSNISDMSVVNYKHVDSLSNSLPSNFVTDVIRLPDSSIWLSTEGAGICKLINKGNTVQFHAISVSDGLSSNITKRLLYGNDDKLWVSTNKGLDRIDYRDYSVRNFTSDDGLPVSAFQQKASSSQNGYLFFGGPEGVVFFNPSEIQEAEAAPQLILGEFRLQNKKINIGDTINRRIILNKQLNLHQQIELKHTENVFSIELVSFHYAKPESHFIKYRLSPTDKDWIEVPSMNRFITYNGLQPGEYTFEAMCSNSSGSWSEVTKLFITIKPPFWETLWFRILVVLLIVGVIFAGVRIRIRQIKERNRLLEEEVSERTEEIRSKNVVLIEQKEQLNNQNEELKRQSEYLNETNTQLEERQQIIEEQAEELRAQKETLEELNATKDKFYSILAHDLKNPFNALLGYLELLKIRHTKYDAEKRNKMIAMTLDSAKLIYKLVQNLLQWSRAQRGILPYKPISIDIHTLIDEEIGLYNHLGAEKGIDVIIDYNLKQPGMVADENMIQTVLRNLLSNSIKFTESGGKITLGVRNDNEKALFSVEDTGVGIPNDIAGNLFRLDRHYTTPGTENESGTGLGLILCKEFIDKHGGKIWVESVENSGTTIYFTIPLDIEPVV